MKYDILVASGITADSAAREMAGKVQARLEDGWALMGQPFGFSHLEQAALFQPMVKLAPPIDVEAHDPHSSSRGGPYLN